MGTRVAQADAAYHLPLVIEQTRRDRPSLVLAAQQVVYRQAYLVEELLAEITGPGGELDGRDRHAWRVERRHDHRQPAVLGGIRVGTREHQAEVGDVRTGRPDLRAVDDIGPAVPNGPGAHSGHVRTAARLRQQLD